MWSYWGKADITDRWRSCSTCFFSWRDCFPTSSEVRCNVLSPLIAEKNPLLESHCSWLCSLLPSDCCYFSLLTSSAFSFVCPVLPVVLMLFQSPASGDFLPADSIPWPWSWILEPRGSLSLCSISSNASPKTHISKALPWLSSLDSLFLSPARGAALCHLLLFLDVLDL